MSQCVRLLVTGTVLLLLLRPLVAFVQVAHCPDAIALSGLPFTVLIHGHQITELVLY